MTAKLRLFALLAAMAAVLFIAGRIYFAGGDRVRNAVEKQNAKAANDADLAAMDLDDCNRLRAGGCRVFFDFDAGKCRWREADRAARQACDGAGGDGG